MPLPRSPDLVRLLRRARWAHRSIVAPVLAFALPTPCLACDRPLGRRQYLGMCLLCWAAIRPISDPVCPTCALGPPGSTDLLGPAGGRCAGCVLNPPAWTQAVAAVPYDARARRLLLRAKLGGRRELFWPMALQLARACAASGIGAGCSRVVPVPSHPWANLRRGFTPAVEIGRGLARRNGLELSAGLLALRWRSRLAVKRLGARGRRERPAALRPAPPLPAEPVLLVDDVMTTGGTLDACARELLRAGASEVRVAVWARTPPRGVTV